MSIHKSTTDGVYFYFCPACGCAHWFSSNGRSPSFPDKTTGPKWDFNGDFQKPTVRASILVRGQFTCHCFITNGRIEYLTDCTHDFAGKTIDMVPFEW